MLVVLGVGLVYGCLFVCGFVIRCCYRLGGLWGWVVCTGGEGFGFSWGCGVFVFVGLSLGCLCGLFYLCLTFGLGLGVGVLVGVGFVYLLFLGCALLKWDTSGCRTNKTQDRRTQAQTVREEADKRFKL